MSKEIEQRADMVARHLFLMTSLPPGFCASVGNLVLKGDDIDRGGTLSPVDCLLTDPGAPFRNADDVANFCADIIEAEAPEAAARLRGFFR